MSISQLYPGLTFPNTPALKINAVQLTEAALLDSEIEQLQAEARADELLRLRLANRETESR